MKTAPFFTATAIILALSACSAGKSTDLAKTNVGQQFASTSLSPQFAQVEAPYIGVLHVPIGVTADAQDLYSETFVDWLDIDDDGGDERLAFAHQSFVASNGLTAPLRSGLDLGIMMGGDDDFLIAHYVVAEQNGVLVRDYLDDPEDFPPALAHVDLQFHTEPRDPLLYTGDGDVLTLGTVGAPTVALAYSPDFSDIFATSDKLEGTTFLGLMAGRSGADDLASLSTEMVSFDQTPATLADTRQYLRGTIIDAIEKHAQPERMMADDRDWLAFYDVQQGSTDLYSIAEVEAEVIVARNQGLRRIIEAQTGGGILALRRAEMQTYDRRRAIAREQTSAEIGRATGMLTLLAGAAVGTMAASAGDQAALTQMQGVMTQGAGMAEGSQMELDALSGAASDVVEAFGEFFEDSIEPNVGGVISTEFGRIDTSAGLDVIKQQIRTAQQGET